MNREPIDDDRDHDYEPPYVEVTCSVCGEKMDQSELDMHFIESHSSINEGPDDEPAALEDHAHIAELVQGSRFRANRVYRCAKCRDPMFEVPTGVGEYVGA